MKTTKYLTDVTVKDSMGNETTLEVHEIIGTGKVFAIDWSYLDQVRNDVYDPYDGTPIRAGDSEANYYNVRDERGRFVKQPYDPTMINDEGICEGGKHSFIDEDNEGEYGYEVCRWCGLRQHK